MTELIQPKKDIHKYVIGIDFGHGETSAAICEIDWNQTADESRQDYLDLDMIPYASQKVIPSSICIDKTGRLHIGNAAFNSLVTKNADRIAVNFKEAPISTDGKYEELMIKYMRAVYANIQDCCKKSGRELTGFNHLVYLARPSGWNGEQTKKYYKAMAIKAGLPLAGLTSESRAALYYARVEPKLNLKNKLEKGSLVVDLGSSSLDLTYMVDAITPIDNGYECGASIIDDVIYDDVLERVEGLKKSVEEHNELKAIVKYNCRMIKEEAYSQTSSSIPTSRVVELYRYFDDSKIPDFRYRIENIQQLNDLIEQKSHYQTKVINALLDFKDNIIKGKPINRVLLTGGASRMCFFRDIVQKTLCLTDEQVLFDADAPSLSISRGIALIGIADAKTNAYSQDLLFQLEKKISESKFKQGVVSSFSKLLFAEVWGCIECACGAFVQNENNSREEELRRVIEGWVSNIDYRRIVTNAFNKELSKETSLVDDILRIVNIYDSSVKKLNETEISINLFPDGEDYVHLFQKMQEGMSRSFVGLFENIFKPLDRIISATPLFFKKVECDNKRKELLRTCARILHKKSGDLNRINIVRHYLSNKSKQEKVFTKLVNEKLKDEINKHIQDFYKESLKENINKVRIPIE